MNRYTIMEKETLSLTENLITICKNDDRVIDWSIPDLSPRKLIESFSEKKKDEFRYPERRTDIKTSMRGGDMSEPNPLDFAMVVTSQRGAVSVDRYAVARYLNACRVVFSNTVPYRYDGRTYTAINDDDISRLIYNAIATYPTAPFVTRTMVNDIIAFVRVTNMTIDIPRPEGWDEEGKYDDPTLIPFDNGLYSIERDELLPFSPFVFVNHRLATAYIPSIQNHPVEKIYESILPDKDTRAFFFEMVGYMMYSPTLSPPAIFVTYGPGQTGKSALQSTVTKACGNNNVSKLDLTQIAEKFTNVELQDKLINVCGETGSQRDNQYNKIDGDLMKRLAEGDEITVQQKHGKAFKMRNTAKLWFLSNSLPDFGDLSSGMLRRVYVIPCRKVQSWEAQIYSKLQEPEALVWLMNRAMRGYIDFLNRGKKFKISEEMRKESRAYRSQNGIMDFFDMKYGSSESEFVRMNLNEVMVSEIYDEYRNYTVSAGGKAFSKRKFNELIRNEYRMETVKVRTVQPDGKPTNLLQFKKI